MNNLIISTIVWGNYYKNFIDYTIPTLLTKGNLDNKKIKFHHYICSDENSWNKMNESESFNKLKELGDVVFFPYKNITESSIPNKVNQFTGITLRKAYENKLIHFIVCPDAIFSKNYLLKNLEILGDDIECIASPGSRVSEKIFLDLKNLKRNQIIEVSSLKLSSLALKFKNKWSYFNEIDSKYRSQFSSGITITDKNNKYRLSVGHKTTPILCYVNKPMDYKKFGSIDFALPTMLTHPKKIYLPKNSSKDEFHYGLSDDELVLKEGIHFVKEKLTILGFSLQWINKYFSGEEYLLKQIVTEVSNNDVFVKKNDLNNIKKFQYCSLILIFFLKLIIPIFKLKNIFFNLKIIYIRVINLIKRIILTIKKMI